MRNFVYISAPVYSRPGVLAEIDGGRGNFRTFHPVLEIKIRGNLRTFTFHPVLEIKMAVTYHVPKCVRPWPFQRIFRDLARKDGMLSS
jgi:hypothetical protein